MKGIIDGLKVVRILSTLAKGHEINS